MMAAAPVRVQRFRRHPLPPGARYVGRPTAWGNPFRIPEFSRAEALALYRTWAREEVHRARVRRSEDWLGPLRGVRFLACWCALDVACHADILRELLADPDLDPS